MKKIKFKQFCHEISVQNPNNCADRILDFATVPEDFDYLINYYEKKYPDRDVVVTKCDSIGEGLIVKKK
jgi:hypothetical protein